MDTIRDLRFTIKFSSKRLVAAVTSIALLNLVMLAGTWVFNAFYTRLPNWEAGSDIKYILVQFYLPRENVIAVWYSSMLLLLIAIAALLCFVVDHKNLPGRRNRTLTYGWVLTAMAFMALSLDEIGSLHERISMLSDWIPFDVSGWLIFLMIPIALFALFMSVFGWIRLRQNRWAFVLLILGVLLFISIPIQEQFEIALWHSAVDMDTWQRPVSHMLFEEGAELFGALSIFSGLLVYLLAAFRGGGGKTQIPEPRIEFRLTRKNFLTAWSVLVVSFSLGMTLINILTQHTVPGDDGLPENWFPSAMAGFTALVCFLIWDSIPVSNKKQRTLYLMTALYSLVMSAFYGANMPGWLFIPQETGSLIRGAVYGSLFLGAILLSIGFHLQVKTWWGRVGAVSWVLLLGFAFISGWTYKAPLAFVAFALLLASLFPHFYPWMGSTPAAARLTAPGMSGSPSAKVRLIYLRDLLRELVLRDMKLRYKRSVLGIAWSLLNPLAQLLVFYFIFSLVMPLEIPNYALFVFVGLLSWTWFQASLFQATGAIVDNPDLIRHPGFPPAVLPIVTVSTHFIHFLLALPIVLVFLLLGRAPVSMALLALPLVILLQFIFSLSLSYGAAALHVTFRDTQYLLGIVLTLAFYLTPIFYDPGFIPDRLRVFYNLNPMVHLVEAYRAILLHGEFPAIQPLILVGLSSLLILMITYSLFTRTSYHFVEEL